MTRKTAFFEGWSWFKFNNLGLALGTNLKFYTSLSKGLKLKVRKFWGLILTFVEVTGEKLVGVGVVFLPPILIRVNIISSTVSVQSMVGVVDCIFECLISVPLPVSLSGSAWVEITQNYTTKDGF